MLLLNRLTSQQDLNPAPVGKIRRIESHSKTDSGTAAEPASAPSPPDIPTYLLSERDWVRQFGY